MRYFFFLFFAITSFCVEAQDWTPLQTKPTKDGLELNPLKGLSPLFEVSNDFPYSVRGSILGFDAIVSGLEDEDFNWDQFDAFLDELGQAGRFGYLHVNVDMGFNRSDLPDFLSNVDRIYYDGTDPDDETSVPSVVVNYNDEEMMTAMLRFIEEFGEKYNGDPRVFLVHYGLYGIFGEWDLGFGKRFVPEGENWEMTEANQRRITEAYEAAFPDKILLARFPENVPEPQTIGFSDGLYFGASISDNPALQWFFQPKLVANNAGENWRTYPIGGEVDPDVQPILWENFPNTVIGLPGVPQETEAVFEQTRPTFLFHNHIFNNITQSSHPVMWDNALKATRRTGYTFHVNEYRLTASGGLPTIEVNIQNTGLAPMYADWAFEFAYLGSNGELIPLGTDANWNISSIMPDVAQNYRSFASNVAVPDGPHTFLLRIVNPLEAISAQAPPVRFDNATQDVDHEGWLTLGEARIVDGSVGEAPVAVTDLILTPATATMGLFDQLQLQAEILPADATNQGVTWSSNRPATASVDQNGLVTTNTLGGDVIITATSQDGGIVRTANITVESFWVVPGVVEAEGFTDVFSAQVGPTPAGEASESVLGFIGDDTWMEYVIDVSEPADFVADFRASSPAGLGEIQILDAAGNQLSTVLFSPGTSNYDTYATYTSGAFSLPAGRYTIRLDVIASAFNLNWIEFRPDPCTTLDPNLIGTDCQDGNARTVNDVYGTNCECAGTPVDNYVLLPARIEAEGFTQLLNAQVSPVPAGEDGGEVLGFIGDDTWMEYAVNVTEAAEFVLDFRAASPAGVGNIDVLDEAGATVTSISLTPATASYDDYGTYTTAPFMLPEGEYILRLDVVSSAFNLNWIEFRYAVECELPVGSDCNDNDDATENETVQVDCSCVGIPATAFTDIPGLLEAENFYDVFNVQVNQAPVSESGGNILGFIGDDTWMEYGVRVAEEMEFVVDFRASSPAGVGVINVLDDAGNILATVELNPSTAGYDDYAVFTSSPFTLPVGSHILRLDVVASAFNLNWIEFRPAQALPITLTEFRAEPNGKVITLSWATSREVENEGFFLERSAGVAGFESIAWIEGAGNTESFTTYSFADARVEGNQDYYYRLAQKDWGGSITYSETVSARLDGFAPDAGSLIDVYPNPAENTLTVKLKDGDFDTPLANGRIRNVYGKVVLAGIADYQRIDLSGLPAGVYFLEVEVAGRAAARKVIKR